MIDEEFDVVVIVTSIERIMNVYSIVSESRSISTINPTTRYSVDFTIVGEHRETIKGNTEIIKNGDLSFNEAEKIITERIKKIGFF